MRLLDVIACAIGGGIAVFLLFAIFPRSTDLDDDSPPLIGPVEKTDRYYYGAEILRVVDGDTVEARIDLGFDTHRVEMLRLAGIDAPEVRGSEREEGEVVKAWLEARIAESELIEVRTFQDKKGTFHRYLAVLFLDGVDVNAEMVEEGLAVRIE